MRDHGGGAIITFADVAALRPWAEYAPYCAAKAGVVALTQALAKELAPTVRVNAIAPGPVLFPDDFDAEARAREIGRTLLRRAGEPEHVADAVVTLLRNDYMTGVVLPVDGGRLLT
jgi:NAD(P)-dependent dehydrogenase (short-subunit alcohol dehydrogenase family)